MCRPFLLGGVLLTMATIATAAPAGPVSISTTVLTETRIAAANGTTQIKLVPAKRVVPGDHVVYQIQITNSGAKPVNGVAIANPVPPSMQYAGPAGNSPAPEVSADGKSFGQLASLRIAVAGGQIRPATAADVRVVRWRLTQPVPAGGVQQVSFRALLK